MAVVTHAADAVVAAPTPVSLPTPGAPGVYVHVPFCAHRCDYCDFAVTTGADALARRRSVAALPRELATVAAAGPAAVAPRGAAGVLAAPDGAADIAGWPVFGSVFVGGGTPTLLDADDLAGVVRAVATALPLAGDAEITVEANPETVIAESLATLVAAGVTRLSLGAQSFSPSVLATLGRRHDVSSVASAVTAARAAGVAQVSVDLIYGTPGERDADWHASLRQAVGLGVDHVSCYALTVEANTPFAARVRRGEVPDIDEDVQARRMATADAVLAAAGLRRYEVSNWARPGAESAHNRTYWRGGDWLALGASSHGHWQGRRWWNVRPTGRYLAAVEAGGAPVAGAEVLTAEQRRTERLLTGLRTVDGVPRAAVTPVDEAQIGALVRAGLLVDDAARLRLTPAGLPLADGIALRLLPARERC